jgi:hypothetical protein
MAYTAETHTKRRAAQHDCLPSLLSDGDKGIVIVYSEEKNCPGQQRPNKNSCPGTTSPMNQPRKDPFHFVLFESPFTAVSTTASTGPPFLVSLHGLYSYHHKQIGGQKWGVCIKGSLAGKPANTQRSRWSLQPCFLLESMGSSMNRTHGGGGGSNHAQRPKVIEN